MKFIVFLGTLLVLCGCDSIKTTKELCLTHKNAELIQQRMKNSYKSGLEAEIKEGLEKRDVIFLKCLLEHNYDEVKQRAKDIQKIRHVDTILTRAINSDWNVKDITSLLESVKGINVVDSEEKSPLMLACSRGDMELVKLLISKGASINFLSKNGDTPLSSAVSSGNLELVKFIIESGAGKNLGNSPLSYALALKDKTKAGEMANYLLKEGVKYSFRDLVTAAENGMDKTVDTLLSLGVNPVGKQGYYTPLMAASWKGHTNIIRRLLKTKAGKKYYKRGICRDVVMDFPMGLEQTHLGASILSLETPSGIRFSGYVSANALLYAVSSNNLESVKLLLEAGSDPNYDTSLICLQRYSPHRNGPLYEGEAAGCVVTPLIIASEKGNQEMIKLLLKYGAKINHLCRATYYSSTGQEEYYRTAFSVAKDEATRNLLAQLGASR